MLSIIQHIVTNPHLEKIAEDIERFGLGNLSLQPMQKSLRYRRPLRTQVQIRDDPNRHALINHHCFFDNHWLDRHILMTGTVTRSNGFDFIYDLSAFNDFSEDTVAPTLAGG